MSDTEYPDDEGLVVLLRNEIDQLCARAEKAEADLAVVVDVLPRVHGPVWWRTFMLGSVTYGSCPPEAVPVLRRLLTEGSQT